MAHNPNLFAYAALLAWPLVSLCLFAALPVKRALIWTLLGAYLLLPVGTVIKFAGIPGFDKESVPALMALLGCFFFARSKKAVKKHFGIPELLVTALVVSPFITSEFNGDALEVGGEHGSFVIPGVGHYEALSASVSELIVLLPFWLGRRFLRSSDDNLDVLRILTIAGLAYSLPMLFEVRMSPQLHTWIYGYFPHSFAQQMRDGGFRPVVFLGHGLIVAFFGMTTVLASTALWKTNVRVSAAVPPALVTAWLGGTLLLCKSLGSLVYASVCAPLIFFAKPRLQVRLAVVLATIALTYPVLRTLDLVPTESILNAAASVSAERAESLKVRLDQEKMLLAHALERPWFGWGRFGRGRVYDEWGKDVSITDGHWIITITTFGLFGFLAEFGLIALSVFRAASALRFASSNRERVYLAALALIVAVGMIDLLPNASISAWSWLLMGSLLGRAETVKYGIKRLKLKDGFQSKHLASHELAESPNPSLRYR
jgi:hypothetical protein